MPPQHGEGCCVSCSGERRPKKGEKGRLIGLLIVEPHKKGVGNCGRDRAGEREKRLRTD